MAGYTVPPQTASGWRSSYQASHYPPSTPHQQAGKTLPDRSGGPGPLGHTASGADIAMLDDTEPQTRFPTWVATPSPEFEERLHVTDTRLVRNIPYGKYPRSGFRFYAPPDSDLERIEFLKIMRKNWGTGWFMTLSDMLGEEFFGEEVSREVFSGLAKLSSVPGAGGPEGRKMAKKVLKGVVDERKSTILRFEDVELAVVLLGRLVQQTSR